MRFLPDNVITTRAAATVNSAPISATQLFACAAQLIATGSAAGTMKLQMSNDRPDTPSVPPTNWTDIANATVSVSGAGTYLIPKTDLCYQWVRVSYTNSGTGNITVNFTALGV